MSGDNTGLSWDGLDVTDDSERRYTTDVSVTLSNLSTRKRAQRRRRELRAQLVREHMESTRRTPTLLQSLLARFAR
ncbi:MAG: hypothetical protein QNJ85_04115 [Gammaproteobacteria bacterium]|nr:hypothetical protein [Gammaproteobacteria bacterium]